MMKGLCITAAMLIGLLPAAVLGADKAGDIVFLKGAARIERDARSMNATLGAPVTRGDTIVTSADGLVKILFKDDSVVTIAPASSFSMKEYVYNAASNRSLSLLKLLYGKLRAVVGRSALSVETPTAVAGVKGTVFDVWVDSATNTTYVAVIEGSVELKNIRPDIKGIQIITGGNASSVSGNEPPKPPKPYSPPVAQPGASAPQGDGNLPVPEPPPPQGPGTPAGAGSQIITNTPPIHQMPPGFSKVGIDVVFP